MISLVFLLVISILITLVFPVDGVSVTLLFLVFDISETLVFLVVSVLITLVFLGVGIWFFWCILLLEFGHAGVSSY